VWDLHQIIQQNNEIALQSMMNGLREETTRSPKPEGWALSILADILKTGPPLLSSIISCLEGIDSDLKFAELVDILLPEFSKKILSETRRLRVYKFCYYFGQKYYPLPANTDCPIDTWVDGMPVELLAMSYSAYHDLDMRPGYLLLLALVQYPYDGDERDYELDDLNDVVDGARIPLLEKIEGMVGADLTSKIPEEGWSPEQLHEVTDGTAYDGVGVFVDWVFGRTGCIMLDSNYENTDYIEGYGEPVFKWTKANVDILTEQWPKVRELRKKIDHIVEWLEEDQIPRFTELVDFLLRAKVVKHKKKQKHYYDWAEHYCPLEQETGEEDEEED
jgi:hypothetical protein